MFLALVKVRKEHFCIVLARKKEQCCNRVALSPPIKTTSFPEGIAFKNQSDDKLPPFQHFSTSCLNQCFHAVPVYKVIMYKLLSLLKQFWLIFPLHQLATGKRTKTQKCNELTFTCHFIFHIKTATATLQGLEDQGNLLILIWKI